MTSWFSKVRGTHISLRWPTGGNLNDVKRMNTIIASHDIVAADSYGATLFGKTGDDLPIVRGGAKRGLGTMDLSSIKIEEIAV